jgi:hypothetical protein
MRFLTPMIVGWILAGCARTETPAKSADSSALPSVQAIVESAMSRVRTDTTSAAYKQLNLMAAPVDVIPLNAFEQDTLEWVTREDSCAIVVRAHGPTATQSPSGGSWIWAAEYAGTRGPGQSKDVAPSPDFTHLAEVSRLNGVDMLLVPSSLDCVGEEDCEIPKVTGIPGDIRIGWTADSRYLLANVDSTWVAIDPKTRKRLDIKGLQPAPQPWKSASMAEVIESAGAATVIAGAYRFSTRGDSIFVAGPDRSGRDTSRFVGRGVPVASTRNGQYLAAVRREKGRSQAILYAFRLFHAAMKTSCDAP